MFDRWCRMLHAALVGAILIAPAYAENWPGWRGPRGDGTSVETNVPVEWNAAMGDHLRWKAAVPGRGHASPIVWDDRIFVVACLEETEERVVLCLDRVTGKILWQKTVLHSHLESKHALNSFASSTPATDGQLVFVSFVQVEGDPIPAPNVGAPRLIRPGRMIVAAYDFNGNQRWLVNPVE